MIQPIHSSELFTADQDKAHYKCRLQYVQGTSNKFYEVEYDPLKNEYSTTYGRVGTNGRRTVVRSYFDIQKKIQEKLNKGYSDTAQQGSYKSSVQSSGPSTNTQPTKTYMGDTFEGIDITKQCRVFLADVDTSKMILTLKTIRALGSIGGSEMSLRQAKEIWHDVLKTGRPVEVCRYVETEKITEYINANKWTGRYYVETAFQQKMVHWTQPMFAQVSYVKETESGAWVAYTKDHEKLMTIPLSTMRTLEGWQY